jgi:hypothetical protein
LAFVEVFFEHFKFGGDKGMNGRALFIFICVLFAIGIFWMIGIGPKAPSPESAAKLFEPVTPPPIKVAAAPEPAASSAEGEAATAPSDTAVSAPEETEKEEATIETAQPTAAEEPVEEEGTVEVAQAASGEPPDVVEYTPAYGRVTFPHTKHIEDYEIDCGGCHHEDMEGGMAKCGGCHESAKTIFHDRCKGCHSKLKSEGKETGPVKCKECHVK